MRCLPRSFENETHGVPFTASDLHVQWKAWIHQDALYKILFLRILPSPYAVDLFPRKMIVVAT